MSSVFAVGDPFNGANKRAAGGENPRYTPMYALHQAAKPSRTTFVRGNATQITEPLRCFRRQHRVKTKQLSFPNPRTSVTHDSRSYKSKLLGVFHVSNQLLSTCILTAVRGVIETSFGQTQMSHCRLLQIKTRE